jgi:acetoacetate decarboxylase
MPPFEYLNIRRLSILYETEIDNIKRVIPNPLEPAGNKVVVWVENRVAQRGQVVNAKGEIPITGSFEASVDVPVKYKNEVGITWAFMYVPPIAGDGDARMAVGREMQGAPKKLAEISLREELLDDKVFCTVSRLGVDIISSTCKLTGRKVDLPDQTKAVTVKTFPKIDGSGPEFKKVLTLFWHRNIISSKGGDVESLELGRSEADPIYILKPMKIMGCIFEVYTGSVKGSPGYEIP